MIKFILETYTSRRDVYGNTYTYARVTSTITGRSLEFTAHSVGNAVHALDKAYGARWASEYLHTSEHSDLPIREHMRYLRSVELDESQLTASHLEELSKLN